MPWSQRSPMDQRTQFIADYLRETFSIVELCEHYGVSRKTGYKWIDRYLRLGPPGLEEYSRRPRHCPRQTPDHVVEALLEARRRHPSWGGKKLLTIVRKRHPDWPWPIVRQSTTSSTDMAWSSARERVARSDIRANLTAPSTRPTSCGALTSKATSKPATASTAIR